MKADNPPAFPNHPAIQIDGSSPADWHGMTLRDWFAGQALAGATARGDVLKSEAVARDCYWYADALLAQREEKP